MKTKLPIAARLLLGAVFAFAGTNHLFMFLPLPPPEGDMARAFMAGLFQTSYFFPLLALTETVTGLLLLSGRYVPLGLVLIAPVTVNIFLFHLFLDPKGLGVAVVLVLLNLYLGWAYRRSFASVLALKTDLSES